MLQKTKKHRSTKIVVDPFGEAKIKIGFILQSKGRPGPCLLRGELTLVRLRRLNMGFTHYPFLNRDLGFSWWLSCIYGTSSNRQKKELWIELNDLGNLVEGAWCIGWDFNEVLYLGDRNERVGSTSQMEIFHSWVSDFSLFDFPLQNTLFTWSNFRSNVSSSKLD